MKITQVDIKNFRSIGEISTPLDVPGLHLVLGSNLDNKSFDSNGSGKSALFEAVIWGLFGELLRPNEAVENIIRKGEKTCSVDLVLDPEDGTSLVLLTRTRTAKKASLEVIKMEDGSPLFPSGNINTKQEELNAWLGTDYMTFTNSVYFGKGLAKFFMLSNDVDRKELLESILKIISFDKPLESAKAKLSEINFTLNKLAESISVQGTITSHHASALIEQEKELEAAESVASTVKNNNVSEITKLISKKGLMEMDLDVIEESKDRYKAILEKIATDMRDRRESAYCSVDAAAKTKLDSLKVDEQKRTREIEVAYAQEIAELDEELASIDPILEEQNAAYRAMEQEYYAAEAAHVTALRSLLTFGDVSGKCPTCLSTPSPEHYASVKAMLSIDEITTLERQQEALRVRSELAETALKPLNAAKKDNEKARVQADRERGTKLSTLTTTVARMKGDIATECAADKRKWDDKISKEERQKSNETNEELNKVVILLAAKKSEFAIIDARVLVLKQQLDNVDSELKKLKTAITKTKNTVETHQKNIRGFNIEFEKLTAERGLVEFCIEAFGSRGIRSFIFENCLPFITERANYYSTYLTGGTIQIEISPTTTTKTTGSIKEKISVSATNTIGSEVYGSNSDGERRRVDVCIILALQDLIASRATKVWKLMIFDEVMDSLDETGVQNLLDMLRSIASDSAIFIISHSNSIRQYFDEVITLVKENGISRLS